MASLAAAPASPARQNEVAYDDLTYEGDLGALSKLIVLLIGQQGTGKSTLGRALKREFGGFFVSGGELIRREIAGKTSLGRKIEKQIGDGERIDATTSYELLSGALGQATSDRLFLDGYPGSVDEISMLDKTVGRESDVVLLLAGPLREDLVDRLRNRLECVACLAPFGPGSSPRKPGVCDWCGAQLKARPEDDNLRKIAKRHRFWSTNKDPLERFYAELGILSRLNARQTPAMVLSEAVGVLRDIECKKKAGDSGFTARMSSE